jgi:FkbM family methyltransferase
MIPDWVLPYFLMPYWLFHPHRHPALIIPSKGIYHIIKKGCDFWVPSPILGQRPCVYDGHRFERFYKITKEDVVLDVGANIGFFTRLIVHRCKRVICIEPEPKNLLCLKCNVYRFDKVQIIPKAVADEKGRKKLFLSNISWGHTLERDVYLPFSNKRLVDGNKYVHVSVDTIDNIVSELQIDHVDFIKMDIMGSELKALKGAVDTLQKTKHIAVAPQKTTFKVCEFLEKNGFVTKVDVYSPEEPYDLVYGTKADLRK